MGCLHRAIALVYNILSHVRTFHNFTHPVTVYACGLRLQEALYLQVSDTHKDRMRIHVHRGRGAADRYVPLPEDTLYLLRRYWVTHRNPRLIFPASGRGHTSEPRSETPMAIGSVQGAMRQRQARMAAGITKRRVTIHTLRHSYATHLLESGVNIRVIQKYPGHAGPETTMIYLHLTQKGQEDAYSLISDMMKGFSRGCHTGHIH